MGDKGGRCETSFKAAGMWSTPNVTYSNETRFLLKELMQESKLTNFQQRQLDKVIKDGKSFPSSVPPTSSAKSSHTQPPPPVSESKIVDPRMYKRHIKTKDDIAATGAYDRERFQPMPLTKFGGSYSKDKERLANIMAFGEDAPQPEKSRTKPKRAEPIEEPEMDRFDELQKEVKERKEFLREMELLGQGEKYRTIVATEVSQMVREMEIIDKKRSAELESALQAEREKHRSKEKPDIAQKT